MLVSAGVLANGTTVGATQVLAPIQCGPFTSTSANDVWYRFTKSASTDTLIITPIAFDCVVDVRTNDCASGTNVACSDLAGNVAEKIALGALTDGVHSRSAIYNAGVSNLVS